MLQIEGFEDGSVVEMREVAPSNMGDVDMPMDVPATGPAQHLSHGQSVGTEMGRGNGLLQAYLVCICLGCFICPFLWRTVGLLCFGFFSGVVCWFCVCCLVCYVL